jgi:hypothetical protein
LLAATATFSLLFTMGVTVARVSAEPHERTVTEPEALSGESSSGSATAGLYRGHSAAFWAGRFHRAQRMTHRLLYRKWQPTVMYALRLASAVTGVRLAELAHVAYCESTYNPFAQNGRYKGIFQLGWSPFGFSPYDPIANALSAALTVRHDGGWRRWSCRP